MKAFAYLVIAACGSPSDPSTMMDPPPPEVDASGTHPTDGSSPTQGFDIDIGQAFMSSMPVTIHAVKSNGVYAGYFNASSSFGSVPNISVSLHAANASLDKNQTFACARSTDNNDADETSVSIAWLDGDMYYTNVMPNPSCTVTITAASQTSVSASITGSIYNQTSLALVPFTASFVANVVQ